MISHMLPAIPAPLDRQFQPAVSFNRNYVGAAKKSGHAVPLVIGLERESGLASRHETLVNPAPALQLHPEVTVCLDEAAASELEMNDYYHCVYDNKPDWQKI